VKKKFIVAAAVILVLICALAFILRPLSFDDSFVYIAIGYMETSLGDSAAPVVRSAEFSFSPQDGEFGQIKQVLEKYSYHHSLATLFGAAGSNREEPGYTLTIGLQYGDTAQSIVITQSPYITIGSAVYRVGYWGNAEVVALGGEIRAVLRLD